MAKTSGLSVSSIAAREIFAASSSSSSSSSSSFKRLPSASNSWVGEDEGFGAPVRGPTIGSSSSSSVSLNVVSRSITSRRRISSSKSSSRQIVIAWNVKGLSHNPSIIVLRPASILFAMAISPSRDNNSTEPISRRYMRTGSSVLSKVSLPVAAKVTSLASLATTVTSVGPSSSTSSASIIFIPISESIDITSSICSEATWSGGITSLSSSYVM